MNSELSFDANTMSNDDIFSEFIVYDDGDLELEAATQKHRCGMCQLAFATKESCMEHINKEHGATIVMSDAAHKELEDLVERLVNFDWCCCFTCLMLCKSLLDHVFQQHPVRSATLERQKQQEHVQQDHSYQERKEVVQKALRVQRLPTRARIVNKKTLGDSRPEYQCYFCGDVSLDRSDIVKCVERHTSNGWVDDDSIPLGNDKDGESANILIGPRLTQKKNCSQTQKVSKSIKSIAPDDARIHFVNTPLKNSIEIPPDFRVSISTIPAGNNHSQYHGILYGNIQEFLPK